MDAPSQIVVHNWLDRKPEDGSAANLVEHVLHVTTPSKAKHASQTAGTLFACKALGSKRPLIDPTA